MVVFGVIKICWIYIKLLIVLLINRIKCKEMGRIGFGRSSRKKVIRLEAIFFIFLFTMTYIFATFILFNSFQVNYSPQKIGATTTGYPNYFVRLPSKNVANLLVNTTECKILDLGPWHHSILPYIEKMDPSAFACDTKKIPRWTYVSGTDLIMNVTAIEQLGYQPEDLNCCYKYVHRIEQDPKKYNDKADRIIRYSKKCYKMALVTRILTAEHINVSFCKSRTWARSLLYENVHPIAQPRTNRVQQIVKSWARQKQAGNEKERPPNVIVIGLDSTSRLNFRRGMFKTQKILERIGAHEMLGYTKVGENTYPNAVPFLTGYDVYELKDICHYKVQTKFDDCPFIWKNFKDANYLTAKVEDSPEFAVFHYRKTGFVVQPTDFYVRPSVIAAHKTDFIDCVGYSTVDQFLLKYLKDLIELSNLKKVPLFLFSWFTQSTHNEMNMIQTVDDYHATFLDDLLRRNLLDNSILFFMSDHGYRYGDERNTLSGWYEDKMPNMWIKLSENIKRKHPQWEEALFHNERRLSSPFDLYHTFVHILQTFTNVQTEIPDALMRNGSRIPRVYGQSFFKSIQENRTCGNIGIPESYCACGYLSKIDLVDPIVQNAAKAAVDEINKFLPSQCIPLEFSQLTAGAMMNSSNDTEADANFPNGGKLKYVVNYETKPGIFLYEAVVLYNTFKNATVRFEVKGIIQRLSRFSTDVSCVHDANIELYCYCDSIWS